MANTVISGANYQAIATYYGNARKQLNTVSSYLSSAVDTVVYLNDTLPTIDLLNPFYSTYVSNTASYGSNISMLPAVSAINSHVLSRGGYASINAFLDATSITVPQTWADLCSASGTTINNVGRTRIVG